MMKRKLTDSMEDFLTSDLHVEVKIENATHLGKKTSHIKLINHTDKIKVMWNKCILRTQRVGFRLKSILLTSGVPQGSDWGPLWCLLNVND